MDPMLDFTGKVALITGAASGFGKLLAAELGKRGARLVLGDINMDALDKLAADLEGQGVTALARRCDVSSEADCKAMVDTAVEQFGRLDMAVNNAGIAAGTVEDVLNVNVRGVRRVDSAFAPLLSSRLVQMSSGVGPMTVSKCSSARKAVLLGFDWGGGVALQYALEKPNRVSGVAFWNGSYRELEALKPLCRMKIPMACCREESEWFPKKKAEAFAQAIGVKVTNVDGEDGAVKVALKMLLSKKKGKAKAR